ncbi:MAG: DUF805 domain-containing protein [Thermoguttaceae bacterium]|jgi:uncharacterized membrane protein YhaH (DUF805 family)
MYCARCGAAVEEGSPSCPNCGASVDSLETEANPFFEGSQRDDQNVLVLKYGEPGDPCSFFQAIRRNIWPWWVSGRASRSEFWYWMLFCLLNEAVITPIVLLYANGTNEVVMACAGIWLWILLIPAICVTIRRLHDLGLRAVWILALPILLLLTSAAVNAVDGAAKKLVALASLLLLALIPVALSLPPRDKWVARKVADLNYEEVEQQR